jgi:ketosteroid isomerase-like protein
MIETELEQMVAALSERVGRLEDLETRLDELESRHAIEDLHRSFTRAVADREFAELADYFCPDAVIDMRRHGPISGRSAIAEHFAGMVAVPLSGAGYLLSSPVVDVDGDTATGTWTWHRLNSEASVGTKQVRVWGVWEEGRYRCRYRRTDGAWRFASMHFRVVLPDPDDSAETSEATS